MAPKRFQEPVYQPPRAVGRPAAPVQPVPCVQAVSPRLLDLSATAQYLGVSEWTVRDLEANGTVKRIRIPLAHHGELRKLLFDKTDLDRLIETWKGT